MLRFFHLRSLPIMPHLAGAGGGSRRARMKPKTSISTFISFRVLQSRQSALEPALCRLERRKDKADFLSVPADRVGLLSQVLARHGLT